MRVWGWGFATVFKIVLVSLTELGRSYCTSAVSGRPAAAAAAAAAAADLLAGSSHSFQSFQAFIAFVVFHVFKRI